MLEYFLAGHSNFLDLSKMENCNFYALVFEQIKQIRYKTSSKHTASELWLAVVNNIQGAYQA